MVSRVIPVDVFDLVIFGGTGDLARRKILPGLFRRFCAGQMPPEAQIIGAARAEMDSAEYRQMTADAVREFSTEGSVDADELARFVERLEYVPIDARGAAGWNELVHHIRPGVVHAFYFSVAPSLFGDLAERLNAHGLTNDASRIVVEKPFGRDLETARALNRDLAVHFDESQIYRIDHYLGKETVQNLMALRFANMMFEPLWNAQGIDHVQITVSETVGLEGRHGFYNDTGALRDMVQNHMLQLVALTAMEPPASLDAASVRDEKVKVLRSLRPVDKSEMVRGQYGGGAISGKSVEGYADDFGKSSDTETYVAIKAHIDNWRWQGVPFYLRTGKRLAERRSEIVIQFKNVPHNIFSARDGKLNANRLVIRLQPEEYVRLQVMAKQPGMDRDGVVLREVPLDLSLTQAFAKARRRIAYERLLLDLIDGDPTLFVRRDEVEAQWRWIDDIRAKWADTGEAPKSYSSGSWGPNAGIALTERDGVSWNE